MQIATVSSTGIRINQALISVSDKSGLLPFVQGLDALGVSILSTGGTAKGIAAAGLPVEDVSSYTGFPEMMDGRVKTLHPLVHGGILGRSGIDDAVMQKHGIRRIGLVVANLYPFTETIAKPGCTLGEAIEQIDIGGPTMLRAAAKNYPDATVVVDPADYPGILEEMRRNGGVVSTETRFELAKKVFAHTAAYDAAISKYLKGPPCHGMRGGASLCNDPPGLPISWPRGHRTTSFTDLDGITCPNCHIIAEYISRYGA